MNKIQKIIMLTALSLIVSGLFVGVAHAAEPLKCGVLPQNICNNADTGDVNSSGIWMLLILSINILSAGVGIVAVGIITYAGFLYSSAQGNTEQVKQAITMIRNAVIGVIAFALLFSLGNYLIPGGIFSASGGSGNPGGACDPSTGAVCR